MYPAEDLLHPKPTTMFLNANAKYSHEYAKDLRGFTKYLRVNAKHHGEDAMHLGTNVKYTREYVKCYG